MSRAPKSSTWTPPTSPEVQVKLEKATTKERTNSPEPVSASTLDLLQTRRQCDGTKSNGSPCRIECKTGYPDDIPFFCKKHVKQADSYAASSPAIPTPAASPEVESRDKDTVQDQDEENHQDDQPHSSETMEIHTCGGVTVKGAPCKNKRTASSRSDQPYYCSHHREQLKSMEGVVLELDVAEVSPLFTNEQTKSSSTAPRQPSRTIKKDPESALAALRLEEPKVEQSLPTPPPQQQLRSRAPVEVPRLPAEPPKPITPPVAPSSSSSVPGVRQCNGRTVKSAQCKNKSAKSYNSPNPFYCHLHKAQTD
ncbi:hypothetical protein BGZ95_003634 [Linnemannia exigua]|uniref:Uncharacterized protein n=1 Tax=Linnemannia exigua TaxID=604196 RepID=A0AAD4HAB6_9FUNG|nr:hypothetical protein BGZ95_003634 [Linnemannia exigua]